MIRTSFLCLFAAVCSGNAVAQEKIYRCGNEYTNNAAMAQDRNCKLVEGANVTVVEGFRPAPAPARSASSASSPAKVDASEQRGRDVEARSILEAELRKAEARQSDLLKEYNKGEPERRGDEARNFQKYLDRIAELKASIARNESDIAGLRRELGRLPASK